MTLKPAQFNIPATLREACNTFNHRASSTLRKMENTNPSYRSMDYLPRTQSSALNDRVGKNPGLVPIHQRNGPNHIIFEDQTSKPNVVPVARRWIQTMEKVVEDL